MVIQESDPIFSAFRTQWCMWIGQNVLFGVDYMQNSSDRGFDIDRDDR